MPSKPRRATSKKSKPPEEEAAEFWEITGILAEKTVRKSVKYLVQWQDDPVSGKKFPPEWVSFDMMMMMMIHATYMLLMRVVGRFD